MYIEMFPGNSNVFELPLVKNQTTGAADTGATVTLTMTDLEGAEIAGETWPVTVPHVSAGKYQVVLSAELAIVAGEKYMAQALVTLAGGEKGRRTIEVRVRELGLLESQACQ